MGKLHTLRRAILRDPEQWYRTRGGRVWTIRGAHHWRYDDAWHPALGDSFRSFVAHTLRETGVGMSDVGPGGSA